MVGWGQLVLGPPGSGKSTYCGTLLDLLRSMGRPAIVVNLDPANEDPPYTPGVDVQALISVADAMAAFGLGPNGALLYCMEFLQANQDWLEGALAPHLAAGAYLILDAPGQAELYTSHDALSTVLGRLARALDLRLVALHLVDTHHCSDPAKFISGALLALQAMVRLELPHINVLSKADQTQHFEGARALPRSFCSHPRTTNSLTRAAHPPPPPCAAYGLDTFSEMLELRDMLPSASDEEEEEEGAGAEEGAAGGGGGGGGGGGVPAPRATPGGGLQVSGRSLRAIAPRSAAFLKKFRALNEALVGVLEDYNLVSFRTVSCREEPSMRKLLEEADHAIGFIPTRGGADAL